MYGRTRFRLATAVILALMLTVALAPAAFAQEIVGGGKTPPPVNNPANNGNANTVVTQPPQNTGSGGNGNGGTLPPDTENGETTLPPENTNGNGGGGGTMMPAPSWPPSNMIVTHAATQVQLAPVGDGLQAYFIGAGGVGHPGPYIDSFSNLASLHSAGVATLYTGTNQGTGKPITIYYLASENKLRISTFYPDTQYDTNKPYVFTVDSGHNIVHEQW